MKINIHKMAAMEFDEAIQWYELQSRGLGKRFKKMVVEQVKKIRQNPHWFLIETENISKHIFQNFHIRFFLQQTTITLLFGPSRICIETPGIGNREWTDKTRMQWNLENYRFCQLILS